MSGERESSDLKLNQSNSRQNDKRRENKLGNMFARDRKKILLKYHDSSYKITTLQKKIVHH